MQTDMREYFADRHALITGGLGFIGSNLAIRLVELGAHVTLVDSMIPEYGGNIFNIAPIRDQVHVNFSDILAHHAMNYLVQGQDYIFHLAGQVSHVMSLTDPFPDIDINIKGTAIVMESCKHYNPTARVIYTGTRGQYGPATKLPVSEDAPTNPKGLYEISNLTAEKIMQVYHDVHSIPTVMLRLTNIYGPRAQMKHSRYGVANWFVRLGIDGEPIKVFGDGSILRDFLYVDDCVEAILMSASSEAALGHIFNLGMDTPSSFRDLAEIIAEQTGTPWEYAPFTPERKAQEPGDFYSDITRIKRVVGWQPKTTLAHGIARTIAYYREHKKEYW